MSERKYAPHGHHLPPRYQDDVWLQPFRDAVHEAIATGATVLDIGAGRRPTVPAAGRPPACTYVGLDISRSELNMAPDDAYDETLAGDVTIYQRELEGRFDLIVCWQVLEHVKPLRTALENIRSYLRPSGRFVGQLSGTFSPFGLVNRAIPHRAAVTVLHRFLGRDPESVFPAYYDKCWYSALVDLGRDWHEFRVDPRYAGATYFGFSRTLQRAYLSYEEWTLRNEHRNLATHYLLVGQR